MMGIQDLLLKFKMKATVVHRLPGRLRVHVDALRRIPAGQYEIAETVIRNLPMPEGVKTLEPCFITANILLTYDHEQLAEEQIMRHVDWLARLLVHNWDRLAERPWDELPALLKRLNSFILSEAGNGSRSSRKVEIPDDVWQ